MKLELGNLVSEAFNADYYTELSDDANALVEKSLKNVEEQLNLLVSNRRVEFKEGANIVKLDYRTFINVYMRNGQVHVSLLNVKDVESIKVKETVDTQTSLEFPSPTQLDLAQEELPF